MDFTKKSYEQANRQALILRCFRLSFRLTKMNAIRRVDVRQKAITHSFRCSERDRKVNCMGSLYLRMIFRTEADSLICGDSDGPDRLKP